MIAEQINPIAIGVKLATNGGKAPFWAQTFMKFAIMK